MIQMKIPVELEKIIEITDPICTFTEVMEKIDLYKYCTKKESCMGRPGKDAEKMMHFPSFSACFAKTETLTYSVSVSVLSCQTFLTAPFLE